jgi:hypothetical protein
MKSGSILAMATAGLFFPVETVSGPYVPPDTDEGYRLNASPATILREYITFITLLQTPSGSSVWPCYIGSMPDGDFIEDDCACAYDTSGWLDGRIMDGPSIEHFGVQLMIRSREYQDGWDKADSICSALSAVLNYPIDYGDDSFVIYNVSRTTPIVSLGNERETKRRFLFTINFLTTIRQVV